MAAHLPTGHLIHFAHTSFRWANLASHNAGVTVAIIGISNNPGKQRRLYTLNDNGDVVVKEAENINPYLVAGPTIAVIPSDVVIGNTTVMDNGNKAVDGGHLLLEAHEMKAAAMKIPSIAARIAAVEGTRLQSSKKLTRDTAARPHAFQQVRQVGNEVPIVIP